MQIYYKPALDPRDPDYDREAEHPSIEEQADKQAEVAEELWREERTK